jgi:predicted aspartyl protease
MTEFDLKRKPLILVKVELEGPLRVVELTMALDTGATYFAVRPSQLIFAGYDPAKGSSQMILTGGGSVKASLLEISRVTLLGHSANKLKVLAQPFDVRFDFDGLIGLNVFKKLRKRLIIDFATSQIGLL